MFNKKDVIYSETIGVCRVEDITKLQQKSGKAYMYYHLRALNNKSKSAYIPVENHEVNLRKLITKEEAQNRQNLEELKETERQEIEYVLKINKEK